MVTKDRQEAAKKDLPTILVFFVGVPLIFIIAVLIYIFSDNENTTLTGWQQLGRMSAVFWIICIIGVVAGIIGIRKAIQREENAKKTPLSMVLIIVGVILMCAPFAKACDDKANSKAVINTNK